MHCSNLSFTCFHWHFFFKSLSLSLSVLGQVNEKNGGYNNRLVVTCLRSGLNRPFRVLQKPERAPIRALRTSSSGRLLWNLFFFNCNCGALQFQLHVQLLAIYFVAVLNVSSYYSFASVLSVYWYTRHIYMFLLVAYTRALNFQVSSYFIPWCTGGGLGNDKNSHHGL
jgi:hypothetical protein